MGLCNMSMKYSKSWEIFIAVFLSIYYCLIVEI